MPLVGRKAAYMILSKYVVLLNTNSGCKPAMSFVNLTVCCELSCGLQHMVCMYKPNEVVFNQEANLYILENDSRLDLLHYSCCLLVLSSAGQ